MNDNIKQIMEVVRHNYDVNCNMNINDIILVTSVALDRLGYRKQSDAEIDRIIREGKVKLNDAMRDSLNIAMGERNDNIAQAWQNGYDKGKSETAKEFAEKAIKVIEVYKQARANKGNWSFADLEYDIKQVAAFVRRGGEIMICPKCGRTEHFTGQNTDNDFYSCPNCGNVRSQKRTKQQPEPTTMEMLSQIVDSFGDVTITKECGKYSFYVRDTTAPFYGDTLDKAIRAAYAEAKKSENNL